MYFKQLFCLFLTSFFALYVVKAQPAGWSYFKVYQLTENSGASITDYQLAITINTQDLVTAGQMQSDGDDIRFGSDCSGTTMYPYWIESGMNTATTVIWVKIDALAASSNKMVYMYYGNAAATGVSAITGTFVGPHSATDSVATGAAGGVGNSQRGFRFSPNEDLLVTSFGKREPQGTTRYITLFNFSTQAILQQRQVSGPAAQYNYGDLTNPIWLTQGTQYVLELFQGAGDGYYFGTSSQIGQHLTYLDMRYCNSCTENTFPTSVLTNYHYGYPDLWYYTKKNVSPAPTYIEYAVNTNAPSIAITSPSVGTNITVCTGTSVTLSCTTPNTQEYLWYKNGVPVNYQNGGSGTYTVATPTAGTDIYALQVAYTGVPCFSVLSANDTVQKVTPNATITPTGPTTFCANTPTTLNATAGMSNYLWKRSATVVGTNAASYAPTASGNHNVTVTDANGCTKTSAWANIIVKAIPVANAGPDKNVCEGASVQIGSANNVANTYTWSPSSDLNNPNISNPIALPLGTTTYTVMVNNATTGCTNSDAVMVTSLPIPPMPSLTATPNGNLIALASNTPNASSVNWYKDGAAYLANQLPNATISVYPSNPTKAYTVRSKATNGCLSMPSTAVNVRLGEEKGGNLVISLEETALKAYPNPTTDFLNVEIINLEVSSGKLFLYNSLGQTVFASEIQLIEGQANVIIDMSELSAGIYTLSFGKYIQKVVKE